MRDILENRQARLGAVGVLAAAAGALALTGGAPVRAASTSTEQSFRVNVVAGELALESRGSCTQSTPNVNFGDARPGEIKQTGDYTLCARNTTAQVATLSARVTTTAKTVFTIDSPPRVLPASALTIRRAVAGHPCAGFNCSLDSQRNLASVPTNGTTASVSYSLEVGVPLNQPTGSYSGGVVTYTLANDPT